MKSRKVRNSRLARVVGDDADLKRERNTRNAHSPQPNLDLDGNYTNIKNIILVFGNDHNINDVDFELVKKTGLITAGVNRIWKKFEPDHLAFVDYIIFEEMEEQGVSLKNTQLVCCGGYLLQKNKNKKRALQLLGRRGIELSEIPMKPYATNSIIWLTRHLETLYKKEETVFVFMGTSLSKNNPEHHFWGGDDTVKRKSDGPGYTSSISSFRRLQREGFRFISSTPKSKMNSIIPYVAPGEILSKMAELRELSENKDALYDIRCSNDIFDIVVKSSTKEVQND